MGESMSGIVAATAHDAADETNPKVGVGATDGALVQTGGFILGGCGVVAERPFVNRRQGSVRVAADWAAGTFPFLETGAVEDVLAEDGEEAGRFVHAFKADGTGG